MDNSMRTISEAIRRRVVLFAAIVGLCGLSGCGVLQGVLGNVFDDPEEPSWSHSDDDSMYKDAGLSDSARATLKDFNKNSAPAR
jgi:hypothetical protein